MEHVNCEVCIRYPGKVLTGRKANEVRASEKVWARKRSLEVTGMETVVEAPSPGGVTHREDKQKSEMVPLA